MKAHHFVLPIVLASSLLAACSQMPGSSQKDTASMPTTSPQVKGISGVIVQSRVMTTADNQQIIQYAVRTQKGRTIKVMQPPPLTPNGTHVLIIPGATPRMILNPRNNG
jgi:hypothetical protein